MSPHDVGFSFEVDMSDVEAGVREADRFIRPRLLEMLDTAAEAIARHAKANHGYTDRTGALTRSIHAVKSVARGNRFESSVVADVPYAAAQEFGARAHVIRAKKARALAFRVGGKMVFRQSVNHPGNPEQGFLRDALDANFDFVVKTTEAYAGEAFREAGFG